MLKYRKAFFPKSVSTAFVNHCSRTEKAIIKLANANEMENRRISLLDDYYYQSPSSVANKNAGFALVHWLDDTNCYYYKIFKTVRAFSLVDKCVQMRVCKHGCDVTFSVFPRHNFKPFPSHQSNIKMKKTFPSFDLGIDHLFPSEPEERK